MLTLQELKQISEMPECNAKLPTAKRLRESGVVTARETIGVDTEILAYRNGYVLYCVGNHATVFPVHSCGDYMYLEGGNVVRLSEQFFCGKEWYLRLVLEGEDRLSRNHEEKERSWNVSYSAISEDWAAMENLAESMIDHLVKQETVAEILQILTDKQKHIIQKYYLQEETQEQISRELGISQQAVSAMLSQAVHSIRKKYPAFQYLSDNMMHCGEGRA